jgi:hypothetical protein
MINGIVNCFALQHGRFNEAVMTLGAASSSLSYDPLTSELYERAWHACMVQPEIRFVVSS